MHRCVRLGAAALALLAVSSCGDARKATPKPSPPTSSTTTRPPAIGLSVGQGEVIREDFSKRYGPALEAADKPRYDSTKLAGATLGPALEASVHNSKIGRADPQNDTNTVERYDIKARRAYGVARHGNEGFVVVGEEVRNGPKSKRSTTFHVIALRGPTTGHYQYRMWEEWWLPKDDLPGMLPATGDPTPTGAQIAAARPLVQQVERSMEEDTAAPFTMSPAVKQVHTELWPDGKPDPQMQRVIQCDPYPSDPLQAVRAQRATIAVVTVLCKETVTGIDGMRLRDSKAVATVEGTSAAWVTQLTGTYVVGALVVRPDQGAATVKGVSIQRVMPR